MLTIDFCNRLGNTVTVRASMSDEIRINPLKNLILIAATLAVTACTTDAPPPDNINAPLPVQITDVSDAGERYFAAKRNNTLITTCWNTRTCERMFGLTKVFIHHYADTGIQHSDTYTVTPIMPAANNPPGSSNPSNHGKVSLGAVRIPGNDDAATIVLSPNCSGLAAELDVLNNAESHPNTDPAFNHVCLDKLTAIYQTFNPFIASRME